LVAIVGIEVEEEEDCLSASRIIGSGELSVIEIADVLTIADSIEGLPDNRKRVGG
jgi:hypothetical protein